MQRGEQIKAGGLGKATRKWRRISLKTLETELEMAGPAPPMILTPAGWRPQNVRMTLNGVAAR